MATKRQLKKKIAYVCGELAAEVLLAAHLMNGVDRKAVNKIVNDIASLQTLALSRVSVAFDKVPADYAGDAALFNKERTAYYKKAYASLKSDFGDKVLAIVKDMNAAVPASEREKLKAIK